MTRLRSLLPLVASICLLAGFSSCTYFGVNARPVPPPGTKVTWPPANFAEVRGYCYDYTAEESRSFFVNGRMHQGVMDPKGVVLTPDQVRQLLAAITVSHGKQPRTPCYKPHHAFVFYDAQGGVAAVFEMCFGCNKFMETPEGLPEYVDTAALHALCKELGLPLGEGNEFYKDVCQRRRVR
jgi:hypothetical protein